MAISLLISVPAAAEFGSAQFKKAAKLTIKGDRALKAGKFESAGESFHRALRIAPSFPDAHLGLGQLAMVEARYIDALGRFERAREGFLELGDMMLEHRARRYARAQSEIGGVRDYIEQLRAVDEGQEGSGRRVGNREHRIAAGQAYIRQLEAIRAPTPGYADEPPGEIYFYIGNALFRLGRLDEAVSAWELCRRRSPRFSMVYNNLALAYWRKGKIKEARQNLGRAETLGFPVHPQFKADILGAGH